MRAATVSSCAALAPFRKHRPAHRAQSAHRRACLDRQIVPPFDRQEMRERSKNARKTRFRRGAKMRKFVTAFIIVPLLIVLVMFAVANRRLTTVRPDTESSLRVSTAVHSHCTCRCCPIQGISTWFGQRKWRVSPPEEAHCTSNSPNENGRLKISAPRRPRRNLPPPSSFRRRLKAQPANPQARQTHRLDVETREIMDRRKCPFWSKSAA